LQYLPDVHECKIEKPSPGIYLIRRNILPLQIVETKKLSEKENIFLKAHTNRLRADSMEAILKAKETLEQAIQAEFEEETGKARIYTVYAYIQHEMRFKL
jgi:hypothetical protein